MNPRELFEPIREVIVLESGHLRIKSIYKIFFICFVVLGLYYPSIFSQFNSIDDGALIGYLEDTDFNFLDLIIPGKSHYYRPVVFLTFFFDKYAWGLEPSFMHLENVIIHLINVLLVYGIAARVFGVEEKRLELPFLAALLFAAHPINTEAICWVAGRTDPLATLFILLAAYVLASPRHKDGTYWLMIPAGFIFIGCLAKEVAFFFFPPACLAALGIAYSSDENRLSCSKIVRQSAPFILFAFSYLYLRHSALAHGDRSVSIIISDKSSLFVTLTGGLKAFGFYVKKLFFPLPLNFAISSYSNSYVWLAVGVLLLVCWIFWQKKSYYYIFCASLFLIIPGVIVAVRRVAWTPVAERYLYAPSAFFAIALTGMLYYQFAGKRLKRLLPAAMVSIIIVSSVITVNRNIVWQDNYLLYKDAVANSPEFARIRNEYGIALVERGEQAEAEKQFAAGRKLENSYILPVLNIANLRFKEGKTEEALSILAASYKSKQAAETKVLKLEARIYENLLFTSKSSVEAATLSRLLIENYQHIFTKERDPYIMYRRGQLLLFMGKKKEAAMDFDRAFKDSPDGAFYKLAAKKLAEKLSHN